jgi:hypothetical protein
VLFFFLVLFSIAFLSFFLFFFANNPNSYNPTWKKTNNNLTVWWTDRKKTKQQHVQSGRSLRQMGSIERLPTVIFQLIQQYLRSKEYCQLINCRKETFSSINYETRRYSLCINGTAEEPLRRILNSVKDKSKQTAVMFFDMNEAEIKTFVGICDGIENLLVDGNPRRVTIVAGFNNGFPCPVFNNILHLSLRRISEILK